MKFCASGYEIEVDCTAKFSVLRIVKESHYLSSSTITSNSNSKSSSNSDNNSNLFDGCSARIDLVHFANVNSLITNLCSKNELDIDTMQEINSCGEGLSSLDIYSLSITKMLSTHGCCILGKFFRLSSLEAVKLAFKTLVKKLKMRYDEISDEFDGMSILKPPLLFSCCTLYRVQYVSLLLTALWTEPYGTFRIGLSHGG